MKVAELPAVPPLVPYLVPPVLGFALFLIRASFPKLYGLLKIAVAFLLVGLGTRSVGGFTIGVSAFGGPEGLDPLRAVAATVAFLGALFAFIRGLEKLFLDWRWCRQERPS